MKARLPFIAMVAGSIGLIVSLYFAWIEVTPPPCKGSGVVCLLALGAHNVAGWGPFGQAAAALAVALGVCALSALARLDLTGRLPLGFLGLSFGVFALLDLANLWAYAGANSSGGANRDELAPAAYVALVCVVVVWGAAAALRREEVFRTPAPLTAAGQALMLGVVAAFVLPAFDARGTFGSSGLFICGFACFGLSAWRRNAIHRLAVAMAMSILVAGFLLPGRSAYRQWPYELWLLAACTAALLALSLLGLRGVPRPRTTPAHLAVIASATVLVVSLFLPWQRGFSQPGSVVNSWFGVSVLALLVAYVAFDRFLPELAIGVAVFVAGAGVSGSEFVSGLSYGAYIGFAAAAALLVPGLLGLRPVTGGRVTVRLIPEVAALALLALDAAALLGGRSQFAAQSGWPWLGLLNAAAILATIRLFVGWCSTQRDSAELLLLPLGVLALVALDAIYVIQSPYAALSWEGWVSVLLCLLLVGCGWIERFGSGLDIAVPEEIWRVDRLPVAED